MEQNSLKEVTICSAGTCIGNAGPGGYGVVLQYGRHTKELSDGYRLTTNNRMALMAAIKALEALKMPCEVTLYTDSELLANGFNKGLIDKWRQQGWKRRDRQVLNADLWRRLDKLKHEHVITVIKLEGDAGITDIKQASSLAAQAAQFKATLIDQCYESDKAAVTPLTRFSEAVSRTSPQKTTVELNGMTYSWDGKSWVGADYLSPPLTIVRQLNARVSGQLVAQDNQVTDVYQLVDRAKHARANLQHQRAERLAYQILDLEPDNHAGLAILCASLRDRGLAKRALAETDRYRHTRNSALLTSRAAAYCDLGQWKAAQKTIGKALAIQSSEEAFLVVKRIKSVRPDLYPRG